MWSYIIISPLINFAKENSTDIYDWHNQLHLQKEDYFQTNLFFKLFLTDA